MHDLPTYDQARRTGTQGYRCNRTWWWWVIICQFVDSWYWRPVKVSDEASTTTTKAFIIFIPTMLFNLEQSVRNKLVNIIGISKIEYQNITSVLQHQQCSLTKNVKDKRQTQSSTAVDTLSTQYHETWAHSHVVAHDIEYAAQYQQKDVYFTLQWCYDVPTAALQH